MWTLRNKTNEQRAKQKEREKETNKETDSTTENALLVTRREEVGGLGKLVMGVKESTCGDEQRVMYGIKIKP